MDWKAKWLAAKTSVRPVLHSLELLKHLQNESKYAHDSVFRINSFSYPKKRPLSDSLCHISSALVTFWFVFMSGIVMTAIRKCLHLSNVINVTLSFILEMYTLF